MRKLSAFIVALLSLAGACASTDPDGEDTASETSSSPSTSVEGEVGEETSTTDVAVVDDRAPGVSDGTIKVGITYPDFEALGDAVTINHGDYEAAYTIVIDDINERGGVHGRMLEPIFAPVDPSSPTSTDETCTQLTQDEQVFVAVGLFFGESILCYIDVNETAVVGGEMTDERLAQARAPWFAYDLSSDAQVDGVRTLIEGDDLSGAVAVLMTDTDQAIYENRIAPVLEEAGIDVVETAVMNTSLEPEQGALEARTVFQRFEASGVEAVLALGLGTAPTVSNGLEGTDYRPRLLFNNTNSVNAYARDLTRDASVFAGAIAVGVYGPNDAFLELGGITEECFDLQRAAGIVIPVPSEVAPGDPNQIVSSLAACQQMTLLVALLDAAGEDLDYGTFTTAGYNLGEILLPGEPEPFDYGPPPHADGDRPLYHYVFDVDARQFAQAS